MTINLIRIVKYRGTLLTCSYLNEIWFSGHIGFSRRLLTLEVKPDIRHNSCQFSSLHWMYWGDIRNIGTSMIGPTYYITARDLLSANKLCMAMLLSEVSSLGV